MLMYNILWKRKRLWLLCCLLLVSRAALTQNLLSGKILSDELESIEFASVILHSAEDSTWLQGTLTDADGAFLFSELETRPYQLTVQMLGFEDHRQTIELGSSVGLGSIVQISESHTLQAVEVIAQQSVLESHLGKKVLRIGRDLASSGINALEALDNMPSVSTSPKGELSIY